MNFPNEKRFQKIKLEKRLLNKTERHTLTSLTTAGKKLLISPSENWDTLIRNQGCPFTFLP